MPNSFVTEDDSDVLYSRMPSLADQIITTQRNRNIQRIFLRRFKGSDNYFSVVEDELNHPSKDCEYYEVLEKRLIN